MIIRCENISNRAKVSSLDSKIKNIHLIRWQLLGIYNSLKWPKTFATQSMNATFSGDFFGWMQKISHDKKINLLSSRKITDNVKWGNYSALFMCFNNAMERKLLLDFQNWGKQKMSD